MRVSQRKKPETKTIPKPKGKRMKRVARAIQSASKGQAALAEAQATGEASMDAAAASMRQTRLRKQASQPGRAQGIIKRKRV